MAVACGAGCEIDTVPEGLRKTPAGNGPEVKYDTAARPLPEVPLPNDVATFADPTSRTGRRINVSLVAPTLMEARAREDFSTMEGWGTSSPVTVAFSRPAGADPTKPAIDLDAVIARTQGDDHDLADDPVYLVNLTTGVPMFLDWGSGIYPVTLRDPWRYFPNDPKAGESNLFYETVEEGFGLPQTAYRPELDRDFDGVLDHPNTWGTRGIHGLDNLLTWYERETDTLVLRPLLPLEEKTEYAVVLTDRLRGANGEPVRSPFDAIHHPTQRSGVSRLQDWLSDKGGAPYFGDIAGTRLEHVAFVWTFTTQPTHEDMRLLRDGLYGHGPFARWKDEFPPEVTALAAGGSGPADEPQPEGWQTTSEACRRRGQTPYVLKINDPDIRTSLEAVANDIFGISKGEATALLAALDHVDHIVVGKFRAPYLLGDPQSRTADTRFHVDFRSGRGDVRSDDVTFLLVVPKAAGARKQPFPLALWGHGVTGNSTTPLLFGGDFARQGIATITFNSPGHGLVLGDAETRIAQNLFLGQCAVPFFGNLSKGRAVDINADGKSDSGGFWWTAHIFHTRDNVRQAILDGMQLTRIFRSFDGRVGAQDLDGDGHADDVAGDFDNDGIPDVGGPNVSMFASGGSLGGIEAEIQGGIDHNVIAAAPVSGGGALALDVAARSYGIVESINSQMLGPFVFAVPASERPPMNDSNERMGSRCTAGQRTVRFLVNDATVDREVEIACLAPNELDAQMTVIVTNVTSGEARCARTDAGGRFRVPIPTSIDDKIDIQVYNAPDVVVSYDGCRVLQESPVGRRINTFEQAALRLLPVATEAACGSECAQFRDRFYEVGSPLVAPNEGLGLRRQSPSLRRFLGLGQAAFDPADPINFAPYYMLRPHLDPNGVPVPPHAVLNINTVGDNFVQVASGLTFGRASGAIPFLPPRDVTRYDAYRDYVTPTELYDRLGSKTPMQVFVETGAVEAVSRLLRTPGAGPACRPNYERTKNPVCDRSPTISPYDCRQALFDVDWVSEGSLPFDQPHATTPLRLARMAGTRVIDEPTLAITWEPRLHGAPFTPDENGWRATSPVVGVFNHYLEPKGEHTWAQGDVCRAFDVATYGNALIARFFATGGRDVYYLSHPRTHRCLVDASCDFFR